ncbi:hypothetical protein GF377_03185 [candidate division GN15 bacterium]|nr:hypothetical protein [candidate division GN15 bacterium]
MTRRILDCRTGSKVISLTISMLVLTLLVSALPQRAEAIQRVAPRFSYVEFYGGPTYPVGEYDNIAGISTPLDANNRRVELGADEAYDPGFTIGVSYGQLVRGHLQAGIGFRYTRAKIDDALQFSIERPDINVYDIQFNANWLPVDLARQGWSPYVGLGAHAGFVEQSYDEYSNEYEGILDLGLNFGAEFRVWSGTDRNFITLASINNWSLVGSGERPKNFNLGFGLRYYFK